MKLSKLALLMLPLSVAVGAQANEADNKGQISFSTEVEQEVNFDLMRVTLYVQEEKDNLKQLNQSINEKVNNALAIIKKQSAVEIKDNSRNTHVRYDNKGKQKGWSERAEIVLESKDFVALSQVITDLNDTFAIENVNPQISSAARASVEDQMIKDAMSKFKHKAELIQQSLGAKGYQIVDLNFDNPQPNYDYARPMLKARAVALSASAAPEMDEVQLESSKTQLKASVSARIQLTY